MEYLPNGDLKNYLIVSVHMHVANLLALDLLLLLLLLQYNKHTVSSLLKYMLDISMGMHYLSAKGFVHRVRATDFLVHC